MLALCLETSTYEASVALAEGGEVLAEERFPGYTDLNRGFALRIRGLLEKFSLSPGDLRLVAVSQGPGFFTSLRVGVAVAKALAHALKTRLVAVPTLWLYAASWGKHKEEVLLTAHPANAREAFLAVFVPGESPKPKASDKEALLSGLSGAILASGPVQAKEPSKDLLSPEVEGKRVVVCGPFAERIFKALRGVEARVEGSLSCPPISALAALAAGLAEAGRFDDPKGLKPLYFSPSQAERTYGVRVT